MTKSIRSLACVFWAAVIFGFSSDSHSSEQSQGVLSFLCGEAVLSPEYLEPAQLIFRKLAHLSEYAVLCALLCFRWGRGAVALKVRAGLWLAVLLFAVTDELHQCFVPGRTGCVVDVLIDGSGAALAAILIGGVLRALERRGMARPPV